MIAVERHVADNEIERNHKRMLEIIRASGGAGLTQNELISPDPVPRASVRAKRFLRR